MNNNFNIYQTIGKDMSELETLIELAQDGDFIWIKPKNAFVPQLPKPRYYPDFQTISDDLYEFFTGKKVERIELKGARALTQTPRTILNDIIGFVLRIIYPGHCAIVHKKDGVTNIIEAWGEAPNMVISTEISEWYDKNDDYTGGPYSFWLGRLEGFDEQDRAKISDYAQTQLGKKFNFFNFDLDNEKSYYCSKLAWLAIFKTLNLAIDGHPKAERIYWFSPKNFIKCKGIKLIYGDDKY
jgi:Permuted papain-like amidase enzyme, YaeF/YiiX, C92 family